MARLKLTYDRKEGRVEVRMRGSQNPIATMYPDEFADFLGQINEFVARFSPSLQSKKSRFEMALRAAMRKDAWKWIGGAVKEKVSSMFGVK
jgi:hypothetical protein